MGRIAACVIALLTGCAHVYDDFDWRRTRGVEKVLIAKEECSCPIGQAACYVLYFPPEGSDVWTCKICVPGGQASAYGHESAHCFGWEH